MKKLDTDSIRKIQIEILQNVDDWCNLHNVRYFLAYGTLLGAIRHKGYIPWDDDIDLCMLREDYECFIREFNTEGNKYRVLHSSLDPCFPCEFAKVENKETKLVELRGESYDIGINIDVFPLDNIPEGVTSWMTLGRKMKFYQAVFGKKFISLSAKKRSFLRTAALTCIKSIVDLFPVKFCTSNIDKVAKYFQNVKDSEYVGIVCERWFEPLEVQGQKALKKIWFNHINRMYFEGIQCNVPENYDEILKIWYGDYMTFPPEDEQVAHHLNRAYLR